MYTGLIMNKKSMDELALDSIMDALFPSRKKLDISKISNKAQRKLLDETIKKYAKHLKGRAECQACKDNLAKDGFVCEAHYHDYVTCGEDWCLPCFLLRSARKAYPDDQKWWD